MKEEKNPELWHENLLLHRVISVGVWIFGIFSYLLYPSIKIVGYLLEKAENWNISVLWIIIPWVGISICSGIIPFYMEWTTKIRVLVCILAVFIMLGGLIFALLLHAIQYNEKYKDRLHIY